HANPLAHPPPKNGYLFGNCPKLRTQTRWRPHARGSRAPKRCARSFAGFGKDVGNSKACAGVTG
ncbi:MAG: hypothetical protein AAF471_09685, partial [Myxococcota bacterium]